MAVPVKNGPETPHIRGLYLAALTLDSCCIMSAREVRLTTKSQASSALNRTTVRLAQFCGHRTNELEPKDCALARAAPDQWTWSKRACSLVFRIPAF
jgi:hypothetical protein